MQRMFLKILAIALLMSSVAYGQSLGDIARENREKQNAGDAAPATKPKVITNKDLPKDPDANLGPSTTPPGANPATGKAAENRSEEHHFAQQRLAEQRVAEQWKKQIVAQE